MKERIKEFFARKGNYYQNNEVNENKEEKNQNPSEEIKRYAIEKFKTRRSIRKYSQKEVPWKTIHDIIENALNAPAAGNIQNYKVIVVTEKKKRHEIGKLSFHQYWLSEAPTLLVVVRDNYDLKNMYPNEGETYAIQNSAAFIQNLLLLAHFNELGACWVEAYDNEVVKEYLGIPIEKTVDAIIPIGYPLENPKISKDPMTSKVFFEKYGNKNRENHH